MTNNNVNSAEDIKKPTEKMMDADAQNNFKAKSDAQFNVYENNNSSA